MFPRSAEAAAEGARLNELIFGADAPRRLITLFEQGR